MCARLLANRIARPIIVGTANLAGMRADATIGMYRSSAHGLGTYVFLPATWMNGPGESHAKPAVAASQKGGGRMR